MEPAFEDDTAVMGLTTLFGPVVAHHARAAERTMRAGQEDIPGDRGLADLDDVRAETVARELLVGGVETLLLGPGHG